MTRVGEHFPIGNLGQISWTRMIQVSDSSTGKPIGAATVDVVRVAAGAENWHGSFKTDSSGKAFIKASIPAPASKMFFVANAPGYKESRVDVASPDKPESALQVPISLAPTAKAAVTQTTPAAPRQAGDTTPATRGWVRDNLPYIAIGGGAILVLLVVVAFKSRLD